MEERQTEPTLTHLARREAQAPLVVALIRRFAKAVGEDEALEMASEVIRADAVRSGADLARSYSGSSLDTLRQVVEEVWAQDGALEIAHAELTEDSLSFDVTRCGYAEMYRRLGLEELGVTLSCQRDFAFNEGFNPQIRLERSQTIMEGAPFCNFRYRKAGE